MKTFLFEHLKGNGIDFFPVKRFFRSFVLFVSHSSNVRDKSHNKNPIEFTGSFGVMNCTYSIVL